jgi:arylsulfatase A-like enzyme
MADLFTSRQTLALMLGLFVYAGAPAQPTARPNIVLILADDLGKYDLSVYGGQLAATPHLDRLARSGAKFEQGYAMAAVCSPSRLALLSGQYQQRWGYDFQPHQRYPRNGLQRWFARQIMASDGWVPAAEQGLPSKKAARRHGIPEEAFTLAERLQERGYRTGLFGKWHLGYASEHHPLRHGFEHYYGFLEAYSLYAPARSPEVENAPVPLFADKVQWKKRRGPRAILRGEMPVQESRYLTDAIAEEAMAFMQAQEEKPFFALLSFSAPHAPWQAPRDLYRQLGHIHSHHQRVYAAMVQSLDIAVGRVMDCLQEQGQLENTLIIFTSDNGIAAYNGHLDTAPHKGGKFSFFEGGINVPLLISWPGAIPAGQVVERLSSHLDIGATIAAAGGADTTDRLDGQNLLPALTGAAPFPPELPLFWRAGFNRAVRLGRYKAIIDDHRKTIWLYDLLADPAEQENRANEAQAVLEGLQQELRQWESAMRPPAWPSVIHYQVVLDGELVVFGV